MGLSSTRITTNRNVIAIPPIFLSALEPTHQVIVNSLLFEGQCKITHSRYSLGVTHSWLLPMPKLENLRMLTPQTLLDNGLKGRLAVIPVLITNPNVRLIDGE